WITEPSLTCGSARMVLVSTVIGACPLPGRTVVRPRLDRVSLKGHRTTTGGALSCSGAPSRGGLRGRERGHPCGEIHRLLRDPDTLPSRSRQETWDLGR